MFKFAAIATLAAAAAASDRRGYGQYGARPTAQRYVAPRSGTSYGDSRSGNSFASQFGQSKSGAQQVRRPSYNSGSKIGKISTSGSDRRSAYQQDDRRAPYQADRRAAYQPRTSSSDRKVAQDSYGRGRVSSYNRQPERSSYGSVQQKPTSSYGRDARPTSYGRDARVSRPTSLGRDAKPSNSFYGRSKSVV